MTFLALDLGSYTGFAIYRNHTVLASGTRKLRTDKKVFGVRFLDFRNWLIQTIMKYDICEVFFERVYSHIGTEAAHVYGGLMYTLAVVCLEFDVECTGFAVQTIKKHITGKGNASKSEIIAATRSRGFNPKTDDEADALAIMLLALSVLSNDNSLSKKSERVLVTSLPARISVPRVCASGRKNL